MDDVIAGIDALSAIAKTNVAPPVPQLLVARIVRVNDPNTVGVPEMTPVDVLTESPVGSDPTML
jgi:hypothetical protein